MRFYEDKKQQEAYLRGIRDERPAAFQDGFNKALNECIRITEECCYKDIDMLVDMFKELRGRDNGRD